MTVKELIKELQKMDGDMPVFAHEFYPHESETAGGIARYIHPVIEISKRSYKPETDELWTRVSIKKLKPSEKRKYAACVIEIDHAFD